jgi:hypothetical protein
MVIGKVKWSYFFEQVCGLAKMDLVCVHAAFRISAWVEYVVFGVRSSRSFCSPNQTLVLLKRMAVFPHSFHSCKLQRMSAIRPSMQHLCCAASRRMGSNQTFAMKHV